MSRQEEKNGGKGRRSAESKKIPGACQTIPSSAVFSAGRNLSPRGETKIFRRFVLRAETTAEDSSWYRERLTANKAHPPTRKGVGGSSERRGVRSRLAKLIYAESTPWEFSVSPASIGPCSSPASPTRRQTIAREIARNCAEKFAALATRGGT